MNVESYNRSSGFAVPAAIIMLLLIAGATAIMAKLTTHEMTELGIKTSASETYFASEGVVNKVLGEMAVLGTLWEQKVPLATIPDNYTEYVPTSYSTTNGIPTCVGIACHRHLFPTGGGFLKNFGPIGSDGDIVDSNYSITEQLNINDLQSADVTLGDIPAWVQVERLDETRVNNTMVGVNLSNSIADGGSALNVRFRITGVSLKNFKGKVGYSTVVTVVELPAT